MDLLRQIAVLGPIGRVELLQEGLHPRQQLQATAHGVNVCLEVTPHGLHKLR